MTFTIQMHNGNGWGDYVRGIATLDEAMTMLASIRTLFLPSLRFRII